MLKTDFYHFLSILKMGYKIKLMLKYWNKI